MVHAPVDRPEPVPGNLGCTLAVVDRSSDRKLDQSHLAAGSGTHIALPADRSHPADSCRLRWMVLQNKIWMDEKMMTVVAFRQT